MLPGLVTPTHVLFILAAVVVFFGLRRQSARDAREARQAHGRAAGRLRNVRLRWPTRGEAHVTWLLVAALLAFVVTRAVALPLFLIVFFALWLGGYGVLARLYR